MHDFGLDHGAYPAPLNYRGFRKSCCTSINHVVCHGIPGDRVLREGDAVNVDVTYILDGWHGDTNRMYFAGDAPRKAQRLVEVTYESLMRGIAAVKPGATLGDIGGSSAATALAASSTTRRTCSITAERARAPRSRKACSSPSNR